MELLMGGRLPFGSLLGAGASRLYYFLALEWPARGGRRWLHTPLLLQRWLPGSTRPAATVGGTVPYTPARSYSTATRPTASTTATTTTKVSGAPVGVAGKHAWGHGQRLGDA